MTTTPSDEQADSELALVALTTPPGAPKQYHDPDRGCLTPDESRLLTRGEAEADGYHPCVCWQMPP